MNFKTLLIGAAVALAAAGGAVYATVAAAPQATAPQKAAATNSIPGALPISAWSYTNMQVAGSGNAGYIVNNSSASIEVTCNETGIYEMDFTVSRHNNGEMHILVTDKTTGDKQVDQNWTVIAGDQKIILQGLITAGVKTITFSFTADHTSFICDYTAPTFTKIADSFEENEAPEGWEVIPGTPTLSKDKWNYQNGIKSENNDANVGCIKNGAQASLQLFCNETGAYEMEFETAKYGDGTMHILLTCNLSGKTEIDQTWTVAGGKQTIPLQGLITKGSKTLTLTFHADHTGYILNYYPITFNKVADTYEETEAPEGWDVIPGVVPMKNWSFSADGIHIEDAGNVGYVTNGSEANHKFFNNEEGVYELDINFTWHQNNGDFCITITDQLTGEEEINYTHPVTGVHHPKIVLPGVITKGRKNIKFKAVTTGGGYLFNWTDPTFTHIADNYALMSDFTVADNTITSSPMEGYDYAYVLPLDYAGETVEFTPAVSGAEAAVTAGDVTVTDLGNGTYSIPTPAPNGETIVTVTLNADENTYKEKDAYTIRFYRIGDVQLTGVKVNTLDLSEDLIKALNDDAQAVASDYIFTAVPEVKATFVDGSEVTATSTLNGTTATYTFSGKAGDKTKTFTLEVEGIHIYTFDEATDKRAELRYDSAGNKEGNIWSNGLYTFSPCNDGWGGTQFKLNRNNGRENTLTCPADMKIKQIVFSHLFDNYENGKILTVTSGDATIYMPSESNFYAGGEHQYDLVINVENHVAGTPFVFTWENGSQPVMWFEFIYETYVPADAPAVVESNITSLDARNHAVISYTFNRAIEADEVDFNGGKITPNVVGTTVFYPLWDLEFETEYTLTVPAGAIRDTYGNATTEALTRTFTTGKQHDVEMIEADRFIHVTTVDELRDAVAGLATTNSKADSPVTIISLANGDYDLGDDGHLDVNKVYNVSFIGQSMEGTVIHGTRTGISTAVFSTRHSTNIYLENLTLRNDLDFNAGERVGVGVALYGGNLDILKNVSLESVQDTYVTGERGYHYNCRIYGAVDQICGGGDHYFESCELIQMYDGFITAPSTSEANKWGYVFNHCRITGSGSYTLGRPWQHEPRCYFLNTTMELLPADEGWSGMSNLPTHFYEYNSMDADGNVLDLSKRRNSPTSTNSYTPVLTAEEAAEFTVHNVLGSTDSFDPEEMIAECESPEVTYTETGLSWTAVKGAVGYMVHADGQHVHYTTSTSYEFPAAPSPVKALSGENSGEKPTEYTVAAVSANGSRGVVSAAVSSDNPTTGLAVIDAAEDAETEYYNLQGIRVINPSAGVYIMRRGSEVKKVRF